MALPSLQSTSTSINTCKSIRKLGVFEIFLGCVCLVCGLFLTALANIPQSSENHLSTLGEGIWCSSVIILSGASSLAVSRHMLSVSQIRAVLTFRVVSILFNLTLIIMDIVLSHEILYDGLGFYYLMAVKVIVLFSFVGLVLQCISLHQTICFLFQLKFDGETATRISTRTYQIQDTHNQRRSQNDLPPSYQSCVNSRDEGNCINDHTPIHPPPLYYEIFSL